MMKNVVPVLITTIQSIELRIRACLGSPSSGLYLTCRGENIFCFKTYTIADTYTVLIACVVLMNVESTLFWNGGSVYEEANTTLAGPMLRVNCPILDLD